MTNRLYIDFETRGTVGLADVGSWLYAKHPLTDVLCVAWAVNDSPVELLDKEAVANCRLPRKLQHAIIHCYEIWAHNSTFERHLWQHLLTPRYGWPRVDDALWRCTMSLALRQGYPASLDEASKALGLAVLKDSEGAKLMRKLCAPRRSKPRDDRAAVGDLFGGEYSASALCWHEEQHDLTRLGDYCRRDVEVERGIARRLPELEPEELAIWQWTERLNDRGVLIDYDLVVGALRCLEGLAGEGLEEFRRATGLNSPRQVAALRAKLAELGVELPDLSKHSVTKTLKRKDLSDVARTLLLARKQYSKSSLAKYDTMLCCLDTDNRVRGHVMSYATHTGRWVGRKVQTQNLPKGDLKPKRLRDAIDILKTGDAKFARALLDDIPRAASAAIRGAIIAPKGKTLVCADYAAVEARGVCWLADAPQLELFTRQGASVYCEMAGRLYGRPVTKKDDPTEYGVGKQAILGLGYGMGDKKFVAKCDEAGVPVTLELAKQAVNEYRSWFSAVPLLWRRIENAFRACLETRTPQRLPHGLIVKRAEYDQSVYLMMLPSGRAIAFPGLCLAEREGWSTPQLKYLRVLPKTKQWGLVDTYGGKLTENAVSGLCRDLLRDAALRVERELPQYKPILTVHDELCFEVDADKADADELVAVLTVVPEWAAGFPIAAEAWMDMRYHK